MVKQLSVLKSAEWHKLFSIMENPDVSELQVNSKDSIWIKHKGKRARITDVAWETDQDYIESVQKSLAETGFIRSDMPFNPKGALFEGPVVYEGKNGKEIRGRAHIVLPPASPTPLLTFAKKTPSLTTLDAIQESGSMTQQMMRFIKAAVYSNLTIVFSGSTGSGKTTTLEACTKLLQHDERITVCEDTPELMLKQNNVAYQNSFPWRPGMDEKDVATLSWIVQQVNRMRSDRVIIGETRGKEFSDFLVAANSGMEGSLTTLHANNPRKSLEKMSLFAMKGAGENVPIKAVNQDIANAVDIIVQLTKKDGRYITTHIEEVSDTVGDSSDATITTQTLWEFNEKQGVHIKGTPMGDKLRQKMLSVGLDIEEFVTQDSRVSGKEPVWQEGKNPHAHNDPERQIQVDKSLRSREGNGDKKRGNKGGLPPRREL